MTPSAVLLVLAILAQVALTCAIYIVLTRGRTAAVKRGEVRLSAYVVPGGEPHAVARVGRSLANQYELPVVFYVLALIVLALRAAGPIDVVLAWAFVAGRIVHAWAHITRDDVLLRGRLFLIGFMAVVLMAIRVAVLVLFGV